MEVPRIAETGEPNTDELADRRAQAAQALPMGPDVDKWKRPERPKPGQEDGTDSCGVHVPDDHETVQPDPPAWVSEWSDASPLRDQLDELAVMAGGSE